MASIFLAVVDAYDVAKSTAVTLYFGSRGFTTGASDTPSHTYFEPRIKNAALLKRDIFDSGKTLGMARVSVGDLVLTNPDGGLDYLLDYAFDGRGVTIYYGEDTAAFPGGFTTVLSAKLEQPDATRTEILLKIRDRQADLDQPIQTTKYAGDNALPDGLEGVADLKGKPKPLLYGKVRNVPAVPVNTARLIYQVSDNLIDSIDDVRDSGVSLSLGTTTWEEMTNPTAFNINAYAYDGSRYVGVGTGGTIITSDDLSTWTSRTSGVSSALNTVEYANGLWVAAGDSGVILTSTDAETWTSRTSGFSTSKIKRVIYGDSLWVAVGDAGKLSTSPAGTTWTLRTGSGGSSGDIFTASSLGAVVYRNGTYRAFSAAGESGSSTDGTTWALDTTDTGLLVVDWARCIYAANKYVLIGDNTSGGTAIVLTSTDGLAWSRQAVTETQAFRDLAFGNGQFLVTGVNASLNVSTDAVVWTPLTINLSGWSDINAAVYGARFIIGGASTKLGKTVDPTAYASSTDLLDDAQAPQPGTYKFLLSSDGCYIRLGSSPAGQITVDATHGAAASDRTAAQLWATVLTKMGQSWSATDVSNLDAQNSTVCGVFVGTQEKRASEVLSHLAQSVGAWWGEDNSGVLRIKRLDHPAFTGAVVAEFTENEILGLDRLSSRDPGAGLPVYRVNVRYNRNHTTQKGRDLAGSVEDADRADYEQEWQEENAVDQGVRDAFLQAPALDIETALTTSAGASAEATRVLNLRDGTAHRFVMPVPLNSKSLGVDLGDIITVIHSRFGLS